MRLPARATLIAAACLALPALATEVSFEVSGVEGTEGTLLVGLYREDQFLKKAVKVARVKPVKGTVSGTLGEVPEGTYALSVIHDANDNGKLDMNVIGLPKEGYGFSNNPRLFGAPTFEKTRFEVKGAAQTVQIRMR